MSPYRNYMYLLLPAVLISLCACSSLEKLQKQTGMRLNKIKIHDLGNEYLEYKGTEFDFFSKQRPKNKRLNIKYRTFKLEGFDSFNKKSTVLFAKFKFARKVNEQFDTLIKELFDKGLQGESRKSIRQALRKRSTKKLNTVKRVSKSYASLNLSVKVIKEIIVDANKLVNESQGVTQKAKKDLLNKPDKVILTDKLLLESKRTLKRLSMILTQSPKLIKSLTKHLKISDVAEKLKKQ